MAEALTVVFAFRAGVHGRAVKISFLSAQVQMSLAVILLTAMAGSPDHSAGHGLASRPAPEPREPPRL
jgi:hypothetical protein